jgi:cytochrome c
MLRRLAPPCKRLFLVLQVATGCALVGAAQASAELAKQKACLGCHQVERRVVGPALRDVAQRYAKQADAAVPVLARKIVEGGKGAWGVVAMPANPSITPEQARQLAVWVLSLK